jgi:sulfite reductase alpha subunit-like flavoprotein
MAMDDYDIEELPKEKAVYCFVSTCGQGELPANCKHFVKELTDSKASLEGVKFAVFGLGDSSYIYYNESAKKIDKKLGELGGTRVINLGLGDDKADEKFETEYYEWLPNLVTEM